MREKRKIGFFVKNDQKLNSLSSDKLFNFVQDNYNLAQTSFNTSKQNLGMQFTQSNYLDNQNSFTYFNSKSAVDKNVLNPRIKCNLPGNNAIINAAASQAIVATQQMQLGGRRTASLKASYEAINSGSGFHNFNLNSNYKFEDNESNSHSVLKNPNELYDLEKMSKKSRLNKKIRTSSQYNLEFKDLKLETDGGENLVNTDEQRYCICNGFSYGEMIYCESQTVSNFIQRV